MNDASTEHLDGVIENTITETVRNYKCVLGSPPSQIVLIRCKMCKMLLQKIICEHRCLNIFVNIIAMYHKRNNFKPVIVVILIEN